MNIIVGYIDPILTVPLNAMVRLDSILEAGASRLYVLVIR